MQLDSSTNQCLIKGLSQYCHCLPVFQRGRIPNKTVSCHPFFLNFSNRNIMLQICRMLSKTIRRNMLSHSILQRLFQMLSTSQGETRYGPCFPECLGLGQTNSVCHLAYQIQLQVGLPWFFFLLFFFLIIFGVYGAFRIETDYNEVIRTHKNKLQFLFKRIGAAGNQTWFTR